MTKITSFSFLIMYLLYGFYPHTSHSTTACPPSMSQESRAACLLMEIGLIKGGIKYSGSSDNREELLRACLKHGCTPEEICGILNITLPVGRELCIESGMFSGEPLNVIKNDIFPIPQDILNRCTEIESIPVGTLLINVSPIKIDYNCINSFLEKQLEGGSSTSGINSSSGSNSSVINPGCPSGQSRERCGHCWPDNEICP